MDQKESELTEREHPFDRLMFGNRSSTPKSTRPTARKSNSTQEEFDFIGMLQNVDNIMGTINKFKPFVKQMYPLLDLFKKQK